MARDRIALLLFVAFEWPVEQRGAQGGEGFGGKEVADLDETVALELIAPLSWNGLSEAAAARGGKAMGYL